MVKVNGEEVKWRKAPNFVNNIQRQILWKNEKTGATFAILKAPEGVYIEQHPHSHPNSNQFTFRVSGDMALPDGTRISLHEDEYLFSFCPKKEEHGANPKGTQVLKDIIYIHYWDGSDEWENEDSK